MDHPPSQSHNSKSDEPSKPQALADPDALNLDDSANQHMIADRLLAALASGNLDNLAQARQAFLKEGLQAAETAPDQGSEPAPQAHEKPVDFSEYAARRAPHDLE